MSEQTHEPSVESVIVQLDTGSILLPRSTFLEVTTRAGALQTDHEHVDIPWLEPTLIWQDVQVPVVNVHRLLYPDDPAEDAQRRFTRLLVMQAITQPERLPFYALEVRGTPHPVRITPQNIYAVDDADSSPWAWRVKASGVTSHLLRLDAIEDRLLELSQPEAV
ncbi:MULTISPECIES: hypothetical protein [unclassified Thioalkalivibrio]|uniref:hypothetical protein n=1 Tax=unclassified Thioalkalivibrio TaxID=2621013 RepID=UPI00036DFEFB|nr:MULTISPECIES: hypothetical protein [unclassified Thioalkalivibrio]